MPDALCVTWPYSAGVYWSATRDHARFIEKLDPEHVVFQTEIDKDSVEWRPAGYGRSIWDYSLTIRKISERCKVQQRLCRRRNLRFGCKIECNTSLECLNVPYLPVLENQLRHWQNCRSLKPAVMQTKWLFDGVCKSPSEELGFWVSWGDKTEFSDLDKALDFIARRDYGAKTAPYIRKAWKLFSEAFCHHPQLDSYYKGSCFIGPAQPLVMNPDERDKLDSVFFGFFYWQLQESLINKNTYITEDSELFHSNPSFKATARRGPNKGRDMALEELREMAKIWEQGTGMLKKAKPLVPQTCKDKFSELWILSQHLAYTWKSAANVEEFLRLRDIICEFSHLHYERSAHFRENKRDADRMEYIAREEFRIAKNDLQLIKNVDFLNTELRLDMGVASTMEMLAAKIKQVQNVLNDELPALRKKISAW